MGNRHSRSSPSFGVWFLACVAVLTAACTAAPPPFPGAAALRDFLLDVPLPPFELRGGLAATDQGRTESGELSIRSGQGTEFWLQLRARVSGSLVLEARFNPRDLLVVNYADETYFLGPNRPDTRREQFLMDLSPGEFLVLLTGRLDRRVFEAGAGRWSGPTQAAYDAGQDRYTFTLDESGLPREWSKSSGGARAFRVEYRSYKDIAVDGGAIVRMPERVRVYVEGEQPRIVLGISEFHLRASRVPLDFDLPPSAKRFRRLTPL